MRTDIRPCHRLILICLSLQPHTTQASNVDSDSPEPDSARPMTLLGAARALLPALGEGDLHHKLPSKKAQNYPGIKYEILLRTAKRKMGMSSARGAQPGPGENQGVDALLNAQCPRWRSDDLFKDQLPWCVSYLAAFEVALTHRKAEDETWTALGQF